LLVGVVMSVIPTVVNLVLLALGANRSSEGEFRCLVPR